MWPPIYLMSNVYFNAWQRILEVWPGEIWRCLEDLTECGLLFDNLKWPGIHICVVGQLQHVCTQYMVAYKTFSRGHAEMDDIMPQHNGQHTEISRSWSTESCTQQIRNRIVILFYIFGGKPFPSDIPHTARHQRRINSSALPTMQKTRLGPIRNNEKNSGIPPHASP